MLRVYVTTIVVMPQPLDFKLDKTRKVEYTMGMRDDDDYSDLDSIPLEEWGDDEHIGLEEDEEE